MEATAAPRTADLPFARPACSAGDGAPGRPAGLQLVTCLACQRVLLASAFGAHAALCRGPAQREWSPQPSATASLSAPSGRASVSQARAWGRVGQIKPILSRAAAGAARLGAGEGSGGTHSPPARAGQRRVLCARRGWAASLAGTQAQLR